MITPTELFEKANKLFTKVTAAALSELDIFPLVIPANKKLHGTNYNELKAVLVPLYQQSKQVKGKGYSINWKEKTIEGTKQKIPSKIFFEDLDDYLFYTKRTKDYEAVSNAFAELVTAFPDLKHWAIDNISFILQQAGNMPGFIKVSTYFKNNKPPHDLYLRELPITVHSKFIEDNAAALRKLLDELLPPEWINKAETFFPDRYNVKKPNIYTQIRILDDDLKPAVGFNELALTIDDSALLPWQPKKVFLIENKACFLSFPKVKNAIAIFGEGFKSRVAKHIIWLSTAELYCWFDMDAAGFEMLNTIRQYYPNAMSLFMDEKTYHQFSQFAVTSSYRRLQLEKLNADELRLYDFLQVNSRRLEQERISNSFITEQLLLLSISR